MAEDAVWNFAYGSNLHPEVRERRRGLLPSAVVPAVLSDWRLSFELPGLPLVEPAMASIVPAPGHEVHGLLLRFSPEQLATLERSEGGGLFYETVQVHARSYAGERIRAVAFKARPELVVAERPPSRRYLALIREGARRSGLHSDYCRKLDALPHAPAHAIAGHLGTLVLDGMAAVSRTRWHALGFRYLAWAQRMEVRGGAMSTVPGQGLVLAPLLVLGLVARARASSSPSSDR
ncbi:gamma-glutamylcyclotransferase family protein [Paraliomyxa miuraensis]|uniref:gamma-glutamylcyclotransferase family protein n=1 Tax=Paraliomyxa miuraensis TaxID=376150 RepID=UPI002258F2C8|nr:gamma-glutamylcyclotransferase family protein [Paraliomyxa miuraensis]MCX4243099.1 gamma-glutamylcyclotransferase [Paraliomyxa miuraensis]